MLVTPNYRQVQRGVSYGFGSDVQCSWETDLVVNGVPATITPSELDVTSASLLVPDGTDADTGIFSVTATPLNTNVGKSMAAIYLLASGETEAITIRTNIGEYFRNAAPGDTIVFNAYHRQAEAPFTLEPIACEWSVEGDDDSTLTADASGLFSTLVIGENETSDTITVFATLPELSELDHQRGGFEVRMPTNLVPWIDGTEYV